MKIKIVYFVYLLPNRWKGIVDEQLSELKKLKLYDNSDEIFVCCVGNNNEYKFFETYIQSNYSKIKIKEFSTENYFEYLGFKTIYDISDENSIILYFHTKGMVSGQINDMNNKLRIKLFDNIIKNYENYISAIENFGVDIGTLFPHIRGLAYYNFFWIKGEYVKKYLDLPKPSNNRYVWEEWIGKPNSKKNDIKTYSSLIGYDKIINKEQLYSLRDSIL